MGVAVSSMVTSVSYIPSIMLRAAADAVKWGSRVFVPAGWAIDEIAPLLLGEGGSGREQGEREGQGDGTARDDHRPLLCARAPS